MADVTTEKETKETDMTPVPTQAELDRLKGETDAARKKREDDTAKNREAAAKNEEDMTPTPTQDEANKQKAALFGVKPDKDAKAEVKAEPPEELPPTPTQFENDLFKTAAMNLGKLPEGGGDPQRASAEKKKTVEAGRPSAQYQTRQATPAKS